jgi:hypothetical protein
MNWLTDDGVLYDPLNSPAISASSLLAVKHFNTRNTNFLPDLARIKDCDVQITLPYTCDDIGSPFKDMSSTLSLANDVHGIVGPDSSAQGKFGVPVGNLENLPFVSHWCSSPVFSNKDLYPLFARTFGSDEDIATIMADFIHQAGWKRVYCIYTSDAPEFRDLLTDKLEDYGVSLTAHSFSDKSTLDEAVVEFRNSQYNVLIWHALGSSTRELLAPILAKHEIVTLNPDFLLVFTNYDRAPTLEESRADYNISTMMRGSFRISSKIPDGQDVLLQNFFGNWTSFAADIPFINANFPPYGSGAIEECKTSQLNYQLSNNFFELSKDFASDVWGDVYDAVMTFGFAACEVTTPFSDGTSLFKQILQTEFNGLTGRVKFNNITGDRSLDTIQFQLENYYAELDGGNGTTSSVIGVWNSQDKAFILNSNVRLRNNKVGNSLAQVVPSDITPPVVENDYVPSWLMYFGIAGYVSTSCMCLGCLAWLYWNRKDRVVINSQGNVMAGIPLGCAIACITSLMLSIDDNPSTQWTDPSRACMAAPVLFTMGLHLALFCLMVKSYRIWVIFNRKRVVTLRRRHAAATVFGLVFAEGIVILAWVVSSPLYWSRVVTVRNLHGFPEQTKGSCTGSSQAYAFLLSVIALHIVALLASAFAARQIRHIPADFQEANYIVIAVMGLTQIFLLGIPTAFALYDYSIGRFVILQILVHMSIIIVLFAMFLPKIYLLHTGKELWNTSGSNNSRDNLGQWNSGGGQNNKDGGGTTTTKRSNNRSEKTLDDLLEEKKAKRLSQQGNHDGKSPIVISQSGSSRNVVGKDQSTSNNNRIVNSRDGKSGVSDLGEGSNKFL